MNSALIVAAGTGTRFGGDLPKQYVEILGKPVLLHTVERFSSNELIAEIVVVSAETDLEMARDIAGKESNGKPVKIVAGGATRAHSVRNGFGALEGNGTDIVAIHDAARPILRKQDLTNTLLAAKERGAACLVAPIADTVKKVEGGNITATVDRRDLRRALTPQCFRLSLILEAFENVGQIDGFTDDCSVAEASGISVAAVEGNPSNIKITYQTDIKIAEALLAELLDSES